jgi:hypothetical protein
MKPTRHLERNSKNSKFHKNPKVMAITGTDLIYDHLIRADIVIIQGYSTTYIESLVLNKTTILCQFPKGQDFLGLNEFPNLPQANNAQDLHKFLNMDLTSIDYQPYLTKYLGNPLQSVYQNIIGG